MRTNLAMGVLGRESHGRIEKTELPILAPGPGQVLIKVERAGVAFGDVIRSAGTIMRIKSYPMVPGYDVAGRIEEVGAGVAALEKGDSVAAFCQTGGYAQYLTIDASLVLELPDSLDFDKAVALNLNYLTAWQMMFRVAKLKRGDSALALSAAGGVGTAILDIARHEGIGMFGATSAGKLDLVRGLGADAIDYKAADYVDYVLAKKPGGVDAAFEALGPASAARTREAVARGGSLVMFGYLGTYSSGAIFSEIMPKALGLIAFSKGRKVSLYGIDPRKRKAWYREDLAKLLQLAAERSLDPVIDSVLPLERAMEAHERLASGRVRGKIVLDCS
jgi:NADPH:quinone reductase-like Zn-dependent oxidoreductase